ncbi:MAG TPA: hypothetical protein VNE58_01890 [Casimicrobiaceae bacterium]|nr:hypothetical protein [Casimicrobiaceae bacterium]
MIAPLFAIAAMLVAMPACGQSYPERPIKILHGFSAGGRRTSLRAGSLTCSRSE